MMIDPKTFTLDAKARAALAKAIRTRLNVVGRRYARDVHGEKLFGAVEVRTKRIDADKMEMARLTGLAERMA